MFTLKKKGLVPRSQYLGHFSNKAGAMFALKLPRRYVKRTVSVHIDSRILLNFYDLFNNALCTNLNLKHLLFILFNSYITRRDDFMYSRVR